MPGYIYHESFVDTSSQLIELSCEKIIMATGGRMWVTTIFLPEMPVVNYVDKMNIFCFYLFQSIGYG